MTSATWAPVRSRRGLVSGVGRLLRLDLRRNAMIGMLPVLAFLFWVLTYRRTMTQPPLWSVRAMGMQGTSIAVFLPIVVGAAAWMGSREARRGLIELLAGTARPRWARQLATWAATTAWALLSYLACVGVLYGLTATQVSWGGPLWWPAVVGAASLPPLTALGFVAGALLPSRFTPPVAAVAAFLGPEISLQFIHGAGSPWQISPLVAGFWELGSYEGLATFYPYLPDLALAQLIFLAGVTAASLGGLGLPAGAGGPWLRRSAAALTAVGLLVAGAATALAGTGRLHAHGMIAIPALHNAADDRPTPYTPVCAPTAIPVCLHPAYTVYLSPIADALAPVLDEMAGLPGAPGRVSQVPTNFSEQTGDRADIRLSDSDAYSLLLPNQLGGPTMTVVELAATVRSTMGRRIVVGVIGDGPDPAQRAVLLAMLSVTGLDPGPPAVGAAQRFAALPAAERHAWLAEHLTELRAGHITVDQLP